MRWGFEHLHGDYDMTVAILVHILGGLIAYMLICAACAMTLHRWSMILPLLTITPMAMVMSLLLCDGSSLGKYYFEESVTEGRFVFQSFVL